MTYDLGCGGSSGTPTYSYRGCISNCGGGALYKYSGGVPYTGVGAAYMCTGLNGAGPLYGLGPFVPKGIGDDCIGIGGCCPCEIGGGEPGHLGCGYVTCGPRVPRIADDVPNIGDIGVDRPDAAPNAGLFGGPYELFA